MHFVTDDRQITAFDSSYSNNHQAQSRVLCQLLAHVSLRSSKSNSASRERCKTNNVHSGLKLTVPKRMPPLGHLKITQVLQ